MPWLWVLFLGLATAQGDVLRIATYNVENYTLADRMVEGVYRKSYPKPESSKAALREVIRGLRADVLVVQEIGGRAFLEELRRDLRAESWDYPHAEALDAADPDRRLGVLSRRPFSAVRGHSDLGFTYFGAREFVKRGLLELRLAGAAGELTLFVAHLKSRHTDHPDDPQSAKRRGAEATAVRNRVLDLFPEPAKALFAVMGDFNDAKTSPALRFLMARGKTQIALLLPAADSRGEAWTHHYAKEDTYSRVDYVLVSPALRERVREGRARIYDGLGVTEASDHRPVWIDLEW